MHSHVQDTLVVLEDGNHPFPHCPKCDIFVTWWDLNRTYQATEMRARGSERWIKKLQEN